MTSEINLKHVPGLVLLLREGETPESLLKLSPEELLLRWFNYQLKRSQYDGKPVANFSADIKVKRIEGKEKPSKFETYRCQRILKLILIYWTSLHHRTRSHLWHWIHWKSVNRSLVYFYANDIGFYLFFSAFLGKWFTSTSRINATRIRQNKSAGSYNARRCCQRKSTIKLCVSWNMI